MTNPANGTEIPLSLFGGLDTEISPPDLPEGVSPANNDVVFLPGSVASRPGLAHRYPPASGGGLPAGRGINYIKTLVRPNGIPTNLILDSSGLLSVEDSLIGPGLWPLWQTAPGAYAKSVSAFGSEYIAFTDGLKGVGEPMQYGNGVLTPVTIDGPGAPPTVADFTETITITSIAENGATISTVTASSVPDGSGTVVTATTSAAHGFTVGETVEIAGVSHPLYNGEFVIETVPSTTTFTYTVTFVTTTANAIGRVSNVMEVASATPHNLSVGDTVLIAGGQDGTMDGTFTVTTLPSLFQFEYANPGINTSPAPAGLTYIPATLSAASGGTAVVSATATLSSAPTTAAPGDPFTITGSAAGDASHPYDNNVGGNPSNWFILSVSGATVTFSLTGIAGLKATNGSTTGGTAIIGGASSAGQYQCAIFWIRQDGSYTRPSPPVKFTSNGGAKFRVTNVPLPTQTSISIYGQGPPNAVDIVKVGVAFTGSGGAAFFFIPASVSVPNPIIGGSPVTFQATTIPISYPVGGSIPAATFNVNDNTLFGAIAIDIDGNNLFSQQKLTPLVGFTSYANRLFAWGGDNQITNLVNMGFAGGQDPVSAGPSGWTVVTTGGTLQPITNPATALSPQVGWQMASSGSGNTAQINQPIYRDAFGAPIIDITQNYLFRVQCSTVSPPVSGTLVAEFYSPSAGGVLFSATISLASITLFETPTFLEAAFSIGAVSAAATPADCVLRIYAVMPSGSLLTITDLSIVSAFRPTNQQIQCSYVNNPSAFDGVTGLLGPANDDSPIQTLAQIRQNLLILTANGLHTSVAIAGEPALWSVDTASLSCGCIGPFACDTGRAGAGDSGEEWIMFCSRDGVYIYWGGDVIKVSQELQPTWDSQNTATPQFTWLKVDVLTRRVYVGIAVGASTTPSQMLVLDWRELNTPDLIANSGPLRISFTGKMIASDISRKWAIWKLAMNCAQQLATSIALPTIFSMFFGCGANFSNVYSLSAAKLTDDDFGQINPSYTTYFFVNHEQEQQLQLGSGRKMYKQIAFFASGTGTLSITPLADALTNPWPASPAFPLLTAPTQDQPCGLSVSAERCAFQLRSAPLAGQTDNGFALSKVVILAATHAVSQTVGSVV